MHPSELANFPIRDHLTSPDERKDKKGRSALHILFFVLACPTNDGVAFLCIHRHRLFNQDMDPRLQSASEPERHAYEEVCRCPRYAIVLCKHAS